MTFIHEHIVLPNNNVGLGFEHEDTPFLVEYSTVLGEVDSLFRSIACVLNVSGQLISKPFREEDLMNNIGWLKRSWGVDDSTDLDVNRAESLVDLLYEYSKDLEHESVMFCVVSRDDECCHLDVYRDDVPMSKCILIPLIVRDGVYDGLYFAENVYDDDIAREKNYMVWFIRFVGYHYLGFDLFDDMIEEVIANYCMV